MVIRKVTTDDWPAIWPFLHEIVAAGETFSYDRDLTETQARDPVVGGASGADRGRRRRRRDRARHGEHVPQPRGPASHTASASFMVDPAHAGRGVGRALGEDALGWARAEGFRLMKFNAVVETNTRAVALWRSLGFEVLGTLPEGFNHPTHGYVGLHVMYRRL